jgi:predicted metal-dependent hydrolase
VVKFIIYHELLHRDNPFHNKEFRKNEHKYPGYVEWDRFLDNTFEKFDFDM